MKNPKFYWGVLVALCAAGSANKLDARTVLDLQRFTQLQSVHSDQADIKLLNLNVNVGSWYLLSYTLNGSRPVVINVENPYKGQQLVLDASYRDGILIKRPNGDLLQCGLWGEGADSVIREGVLKLEALTVPYYPICSKAAFLRNEQNGYQPSLEWGANMARSWGGEVGEWVVDTAKQTVMQDHYIETPELGTASSEGVQVGLQNALINNDSKDATLSINNLGIKTAGGGSALKAGHWYPAVDHPGVFVSMFVPRMVPKEILSSYTDRVSPLDEVESNALVYLAAFDLGEFELGWADGTKLPGVEWSSRAAQSRTSSLPGPDGFGNLQPLSFPGSIDPVTAMRAEATFSGGFQRHHSAFRAGPFASVNNGSHYGFMEDGVLMSTINPGLATFLMYNDGTLDMKTWEPSDEQKLPSLKHIRQNGVPIIEAKGVPGALVNNWPAGNWSGSADAQLRTPRGAACLFAAEDGHRFFVYAYFSGATPNAIARVFQAYGCSYAIHLDMNSPGQAYLGLFQMNKPDLELEHLVKSMSEVDPTTTSAAGRKIALPRYLAVPDYRDFFYFLRK